MATPRTHEFIGFEESHLPNKKYNAILKNKTSGRLVRVPFGARGYEQYKGSTGPGKFSSLNHLDKQRRQNYIKRHSKDKNTPYSASWFSLHYLW